MTHAHFLQLIDRIKQRGPQLVSCISSWNGFTTGNSYVVNRHANNTICATDDQGIHTVIDTDSCQHFSGDGWISFDPAADEMAAQSPRERLAHLASYLLNERESFEPGQIVEWIPGLKSSSFDLMYVIEQVEPFVEADLTPKNYSVDNLSRDRAQMLTGFTQGLDAGKAYLKKTKR